VQSYEFLLKEMVNFRKNSIKISLFYYLCTLKTELSTNNKTIQQL